MNNIKLIEQALDILDYTEGYTNNDNEQLIEVVEILEDIRSNLVEYIPIEDMLAALPYLESENDNTDKAKVTNDRTKYTPYLTKYGDHWYVEWMDMYNNVILSCRGITARDAIEKAMQECKERNLKLREVDE